MVQIFDTILEGANACNVSKGNTCQAYKILEAMPLAKVVDDCAYSCRSVSSLSEPECELDPVFVEAGKNAIAAGTKEVPSKKNRKNRHKSLIDKALILEEKWQLQESRRQTEPVYIAFSDLSADWSCYTAKLSHEAIRGADVVSRTSQPRAVAIEASTALSKRSRKKSLIDKAATQQRKELSAQRGQQDIDAPKAAIQTYCSVCEGRSACVLCGSRA